MGVTNQQPILAFDVVHLGPFEEICGQLKKLHRVGGMLYVRLTVGTLEFPMNSAEAEICERELTDKIGQRVSILSVPDVEEPIVIGLNQEQV